MSLKEQQIAGLYDEICQIEGILMGHDEQARAKSAGEAYDATLLLDMDRYNRLHKKLGQNRLVIGKLRGTARYTR